MRIAFYAAQSGKAWNGATLDHEPLGGSETAVIYIARGLAALGHEVMVFTRGKPGVYDDVAYIPFDKARNLLYTLPLDVLVCARDPLPLLWQHQAAITVLWYHDMPNTKMPPPAVNVFVSETQKNYYVQMGLVQEQNSVVIYNGVDNSLFLPPRAIRPFDSFPLGDPKLVWTSNPERGLWHAAEVLRRIQTKYPNAELHVYGRNAVYGWDASYEGNFLPRTVPPNFHLHDALSKQDLANALHEMDMWVYPTWWPETYCIAAVEAQAAGVPVIASNLAALVETVRGGVLVGGNASEEEHLDAMASIVLDHLQSVDKRQQMQAAGLQLARMMDWSIQVGAWQTLLTQALQQA